MIEKLCGDTRTLLMRRRASTCLLQAVTRSNCASAYKLPICMKNVTAKLLWTFV